MKAWIRRHLRALSGLAVVGAIVVAGGLYWFAPWKLFTDRTVNEALPSVAVLAQSATAPATVPTARAASTTTAPTSTAAVPTTAAPLRLLSSGAFVSHEHSTHGTASVVSKPDGSRALALADLDTSNGPELRVWLSDAPVGSSEASWYIFDDAQYHHVSLGALKGNLGNQVYDIPADADLDRLMTVTIWCDRFNVSFGAAALRAAP